MAKEIKILRLREEAGLNTYINNAIDEIWKVLNVKDKKVTYEGLNGMNTKRY